MANCNAFGGACLSFRNITSFPPSQSQRRRNCSINIEVGPPPRMRMMRRRLKNERNLRQISAVHNNARISQTPFRACKRHCRDKSRLEGRMKFAAAGNRRDNLKPTRPATALTDGLTALITLRPSEFISAAAANRDPNGHRIVSINCQLCSRKDARSR